MLAVRQWRRRREEFVRLVVEQLGRDARGTLTYLLKDLSVILIIVSGGKVGSEEAPAISTEINKITNCSNNVLYNVEIDNGLTNNCFANMKFHLTKIT